MISDHTIDLLLNKRPNVVENCLACLTHCLLEFLLIYKLRLYLNILYQILMSGPISIDTRIFGWFQVNYDRR